MRRNGTAEQGEQKGGGKGAEQLELFRTLFRFVTRDGNQRCVKNGTAERARKKNPPYPPACGRPEGRRTRAGSGPLAEQFRERLA